MATNLKIDDELLEEALRIGGFKTKKDTVNEALKLLIKQQKQLEVLNYESAFEELDDFDHKAFRKHG